MFFFIFIFIFIFNFIVRDHPEVESRFEECVHAAVEYASTIDDFDDLVDPRTLAHHYLGSKPSYYVLCAIRLEEKSELL